MKPSSVTGAHAPLRREETLHVLRGKKKKKKKMEMRNNTKYPGASCALAGGPSPLGIPIPSALALPNADGELGTQKESQSADARSKMPAEGF